MPQVKPTIDLFNIYPIPGGNIATGFSPDCGHDASFTLEGAGIDGNSFPMPVQSDGWFSFILPPEIRGSYSATVTTKTNVTSDPKLFFVP